MSHFKQGIIRSIINWVNLCFWKLKITCRKIFFKWWFRITVDPTTPTTLSSLDAGCPLKLMLDQINGENYRRQGFKYLHNVQFLVMWVFVQQSELLIPYKLCFNGAESRLCFWNVKKLLLPEYSSWLEPFLQ